MNLLLIAVTAWAVLFIYFVIDRWKEASSRKMLSRYFAEHNISAKIVSVGVPPLRFWFKNAYSKWPKCYTWARIRCADGSLKWVRFVRPIGGEGNFASSVEILDQSGDPIARPPAHDRRVRRPAESPHTVNDL